MPIRSRFRAGNREEGGFVLVGVIMFVLALTILGISLFNLSGYEAQFLGKSYASDQALYQALGGIDNVQFVLSSTKSLDAARNPGNYSDGVIYAYAWHDSRSTGPVASGQAVNIRVGAEFRGERRVVEVRYIPDEPDQIYKRLITSKNGMYVDPTNFTRTFLNGEVQEEVVTEPQWQFTPWTAPYGRTVTTEPCPVPDIGGFFATHWTDAALATRPTSTNSFDFSGLGGGAVHYIKTAVDPNPAGDDYSVFVGYSEPEVTIDVTNSGTVVWMLDHGWFSNQFVRVEGTVNDCLVMVSRENRVPSSSPYADKGFDFRSGLHSPNVRLILVSDSEVKIDHAEGPEYSGMDLVINYLSIFAGHVWFSGPEATYSETMILSHDPNSAHDAPGGLIDQLNELGALPNSGGAGMSFAPVAGSWREIDPNAPGALDPPDLGL